jgi:hypothetical protein
MHVKYSQVSLLYVMVTVVLRSNAMYSKCSPRILLNLIALVTIAVDSVNVGKYSTIVVKESY